MIHIMEERGHITLSQFQTLIKQALLEGLPPTVWISAEISDIKINHSSGHCYLELVEKGGSNGIPKAKASAVVWRNTYGMMSAYFREAAGSDLTVGMKILVSVSVAYHELYGLSLNVSDIDPFYTLGDLERQKRETIAKLRDDGVFDLNRELDIPAVPQRLAIISSPGAAGYQDFINELTAGRYAFAMELFDAIMQGHGAEESIIGALSSIAVRADDFDAVIIIRGGGSQSDLSFLNSYMLNFHAAQFPLPIIAGLGHDKDNSILDMVAAVSLKTPTAVAGFLLQLAAKVDRELDMLAGELENAMLSTIGQHNKKLQHLSLRLSRFGGEVFRQAENSLMRAEREIAVFAGRMVAKEKERMSGMRKTLADATWMALRDSGRRLDRLSLTTKGRDPENILALGFAIVRYNGKIVRKSSTLNRGDEIDITLHEGNVKADVRG